MDCHANVKILTFNICTIYSDTKLQILRHFLSHTKADVVLLQEVSVGELKCPGFDEATNVGPARRGTAILWRVGLPLKITAVLPCGRGMAARLGNTTIVNLYAPSGNQGRTARHEFFSIGITPLLASTNGQIIIGGDLNCTLKKEESTGKRPPCTTLISLMSSLHLKDIWRIKHPEKEGFTFRSAASAARLDRFLVDVNTEPAVSSISLHEAACSDHLAVLMTVSLGLKRQKNGPTKWKLDNRILEDALFLPQLGATMERLRKSKQYSTDKITWWETVAKPGVKQFCKIFAKDMHEEENSLLNFYQKTLDELCQKDKPPKEEQEKKHKIKEAIQDIYKKRNKNLLVRSKLEKPCPGENATVYHIVAGLEQRKKSRLESLKNKHGQETSDLKEIQETIRSHFEEKFQKKDEQHQNEAILNEIATTITEEENKQLMRKATAEELEQAVRRCKPNKSPGEDGLPSDLYKAAWSVLGQDLLEMVNAVILRKKVGDSHKVGVMVLVPKVAQVTEVKHLRPITLLNADGKLVSRVLEARLKKLESKTLHEAQVRGGGARNIGAALGDIRDAIAMVDLTNRSRDKTQACLVSMDLQGAFDNLQHNYMWRVLEKLGFQAPVLELMQSMYDGATTSIQVNGQLTAPIQLLVGVRQGCPLSMALFNMAMSPLIKALCRRLPGLTLQDPANPARRAQLSSSSYVDDAIAILNQPEEIPVLLEILQQFSDASGLRTNMEKTKALALGNWPTNANLPCNYAADVKILGITFADSIRKMAALNWPGRAGAVRAVLADARLRKLDLKQRTVYVNTYAIPLLLHLGQVLPMPAGIERQIRSSITGFLKAGSLFTVPLERLTRSPLEGGMALQHHQWKSMAMFAARWVSSARAPTPIFSGLWLRTLEALFEEPKEVPGKVSYFKTYLTMKAAIPVDFVGTALGRGVCTNLLDEHPAPPIRVETKNPNCNWTTVWSNVSSKAIPPATRTTWYTMVHDLVPTAERLHRHGLEESPLCQRCGNVDTLMHRLVDCLPDNKMEWEACARKLTSLSGLPLPTIQPTLLLRPDISCDDNKDEVLKLLCQTALSLHKRWKCLI